MELHGFKHIDDEFFTATFMIDERPLLVEGCIMPAPLPFEIDRMTWKDTGADAVAELASRVAEIRAELVGLGLENGI